MNTVNPYLAPSANLDVSDREKYAEPKFFSASGRIGRLRYFAYSFGYVLIGYVALMVLVGLMAATGIMIVNEESSSLVQVISYGYFILVGLMLGRRRAHDMDKSGWFSLLALIPLVNLIFLIIPGTKGENRYGRQPTPSKGGVAAVLVIGFVLIAVIGILAAIAIPAYHNYVNRAKAAQGEIVIPAQ